MVISSEADDLMDITNDLKGQKCKFLSGGWWAGV